MSRNWKCIFFFYALVKINVNNKELKLMPTRLVNRFSNYLIKYLYTWVCCSLRLKFQCLVNPWWFIYAAVHRMIHPVLVPLSVLYTTSFDIFFNEQQTERSYGNGRWLANLDSTTIRTHTYLCSSNISVDNFKITGRQTSKHDFNLL